MKNAPLDVAAAGRVSASGRINLRDVVFVSLHAAHVSPSPDGSLILDWQIPTLAVTWDLSDGELKAMFPMTIGIDAIAEDDRAVKTRVAEVSVVFRLDYRISAGESEGWDDDLQHFIGVCGYLHAWPYFRSEVQWFTAKLGFPPLVLPVIVSGEAAARVSVRSAAELREAARPAAKKIEAKRPPAKTVRKSPPKKA
jgi:hypothetical protein